MNEDRIKAIADEINAVFAVLNREESHWFWEWYQHSFVRTYCPPMTPKTRRIVDLFNYDPEAPPEVDDSFESLTSRCRLWLLPSSPPSGRA